MTRSNAICTDTTDTTTYQGPQTITGRWIYLIRTFTARVSNGWLVYL